MVLKFKLSILCFIASLIISIASYANPTFQEGDILFQHSPTELGHVIAKVSNSIYSHVGIVVKHKGKLVVLEAIDPVKYTPIQKWINHGKNKMFTQMRLHKKFHKYIQPAIAEAKKFLGRPYDIQYEFDDKKIYCSELIYKAFKRSSNLELGKIEALKELNYKPHIPFIKKITGGKVPLERKMVTPESMFRDSDLYLIYSNAPKE